MPWNITLEQFEQTLVTLSPEILHDQLQVYRRYNSPCIPLVRVQPILYSLVSGSSYKCNLSVDMALVGHSAQCIVSLAMQPPARETSVNVGLEVEFEQEVVFNKMFNKMFKPT